MSGNGDNYGTVTQVIGLALIIGIFVVVTVNDIAKSIG